jgi:GDP-L-fucose synthase
MSKLKYQNKKIYLAGHSGMVGSAIKRYLEKNGYNNLVYRSIDQLDLIRQEKVEEFFAQEKPEIVIVAAARVGGILANNTYRAQFIYDNLMIESNLIHSSYQNNVHKLIFLGSSCIYPKLAKQPLKEEYLLSDYLEYTNEPYAVAKIAGIKLCENYYKQYGCNFYSIMPTNMYGANDNFDLNTSHVLPALLRKFHEAKVNDEQAVTIWGTGKPLREFMFVDDMSEGLCYLLENVEAKDLYDNNLSFLNIGTGKDLTIAELAKMISEIVGFKGVIVYDNSKPDGTPRKLLDVSRINSLGWKAKIELREGIERTYEWFIAQLKIQN